mmetsp:Transcript_34066/g.45023  ORF Transcript_34066/g.45023 Transcript_34066/m.45023 type:complete len:355 (-) Transcript_34066:357-1421(-)
MENLFRSRGSPGKVEEEDEIPHDIDVDGISGEVLIDSEEAAIAASNRSFEEFLSIVKNSAEGWKPIQTTDCSKLEQKVLKAGPHAPGSCKIYRAEMTLECPAKELFDNLWFADHQEVFFPEMDAEGFKTPLATWNTKSGSRSNLYESQIADKKLISVRLPMGTMQTERQFLLLNSMNRTDFTITFKSVQHEQLPGGSQYSSDEPQNPDLERAVLFFGITALPSESTAKCTVSVVYFVDLCGKLFAWQSNSRSENWINNCLAKLPEAAAAAKERYLKTESFGVKKLSQTLSEKVANLIPGTPSRQVSEDPNAKANSPTSPGLYQAISGLFQTPTKDSNQNETEEEETETPPNPSS